MKSPRIWKDLAEIISRNIQKLPIMLVLHVLLKTRGRKGAGGDVSSPLSVVYHITYSFIGFVGSSPL